MIRAQRVLALDDIRDHYDDLDRFYRAIWGEHIHHGLWLDGRENPREAARLLVHRVAVRAGITSGQRVCDAGSGYGASARLWVEHYAAHVTAVTLSPRQHALALQTTNPDNNPEYRCGDWLDIELELHSFDHVVAIESTEHMESLRAVFQRAADLLRPGGRMTVCAWLAAQSVSAWPGKRFLQAICDEARLIGMGTESDYREGFKLAGFTKISCEDLSHKVRKTWSICARRLLGSVLKDAKTRRYLLHRSSRNRVFALSVLRIWLAYYLGTMRYGLFTATRSA